MESADVAGTEGETVEERNRRCHKKNRRKVFWRTEEGVGSGGGGGKGGDATSLWGKRNCWWDGKSNYSTSCREDLLNDYFDRKKGSTQGGKGRKRKTKPKGSSDRGLHR